jgi:hypothetical protein
MKSLEDLVVLAFGNARPSSSRLTDNSIAVPPWQLRRAFPLDWRHLAQKFRIAMDQPAGTLERPLRRKRHAGIFCDIGVDFRDVQQCLANAIDLRASGNM